VSERGRLVQHPQIEISMGPKITERTKSINNIPRFRIKGKIETPAIKMANFIDLAWVPYADMESIASIIGTTSS
jgi:hypothetical protein